MAEQAHTRGAFRRLLCLFEACNTFRAGSDDTGCWGECSICGKKVGFVSRTALRAYAEAEERAAIAKAEAKS